MVIDKNVVTTDDPTSMAADKIQYAFKVLYNFVL